MKNFRNIATSGIIFVINCLVFSSAIASVNPEDPVVLDEIVVTAARWISGGGGTGPGGGGTYGKEISDAVIDAREQERQRICIAIATASNNKKCDTKAQSAPQSYYDVRIPDDYPTRLVWQDTVLALATDLFNNNTDYLTVVGNSIAAAWQRCGNSNVCVQDVSRYYGIEVSALPDASFLRDIVSATNWLRARTGSVTNNSFLNAEGGKMSSRFSGGIVCAAYANAKANLRCK